MIEVDGVVIYPILAFKFVTQALSQVGDIETHDPPATETVGKPTGCLLKRSSSGLLDSKRLLDQPLLLQQMDRV